jgi:hypothetical protein
MASGLKMMVMAVLWLTNFVILTVWTIIGGVVFRSLAYVQTLVSTSPQVDYASFQYIFPAFFFFLLATLIAITYKIYQLLASDNDYYPGA